MTPVQGSQLADLIQNLLSVHLPLEWARCQEYPAVGGPPCLLLLSLLCLCCQAAAFNL